MSIILELNGLDFDIPTQSDHDWGPLTDWIIEVNETLANASDSFIIPPGTANLIDDDVVNLYTVNSPSDNSGIFFEYTITRITTGGSGVSVGETTTMAMKYNSVTGLWDTTQYGVGNASVDVGISSNVIYAVASPLPGTPSVSTITFRGRIIRT